MNGGILPYLFGCYYEALIMVYPRKDGMETYSKTLLVTGGAGFIGSAFLNYAVPKYSEYHFVNLDALTYAGNLKNVTVSDAPNYTFVQCDIRDERTVANVFETYHPTDVIHFAAESHVDNSIASPKIFIETNIVGTENLLECARMFGIHRFHHISTDEVYGSLSKDDAPKTEDAALLPNSPYSASKAASDMLVRAYNRTYGMDTVITRASNNYGPRQYAEKVIPLFIKNLLEGKKVPVYADGSNIREWLFVEDTAQGIDAAFHKGKSGEIYNLGGSVSLTNLEVTKKLLSLLGKDESSIEYVTDRPGHDFRYAIDSSKTERELGWKATTSFEAGIEKTIAFYRG